MSIKAGEVQLPMLCLIVSSDAIIALIQQMINYDKLLLKNKRKYRPTKLVTTAEIRTNHLIVNC